MGTTFAADGGYTNNYSSNDQVADTDSFVTAIGKLDDAIGTTSYSNSKAVNYAQITENTDLTEAVSQVASNIGGAISSVKTRGVGAISASNTVNANISALDTAIGDNVTAQARTKGAIATTNSVNANISALDSAIGTDTDLTTGTQNELNINNSVNANLRALHNAISGSGSDVVHKSGEETITGEKTFTAEQKFVKTEGSGSDAKTYETDIDGKTLTMKNGDTSNIVLNGNDGSATFAGQLNANGGVNTTTLVVRNGANVSGAAQFNDSVTIGSSAAGGARSLTVNGTLGVTGQTTLSSADGVKFDNSAVTIKGFATQIDENSDHTTVATSKAVYDAIQKEAAIRAAADEALDVRVTDLEEASEEQGEAIKELQHEVKVQTVDDEGHVIKTKGNFVDGDNHTIGENVMILDDAIGSVDADGHYIKASKDADGKIVTTMADNIESLDKHLYNTSDALGGNFDETTDKWSADLEVATGEDAVKYGNITVEKVTDALNQIITNVGTKDDLGNEMNGVTSKNSINKNLASINDTIGNFKNLNDSTNITNGKEGDAGYKVPENVIDVLNNIDATLGTVHGLSDKLREAGKYNGNLGDGTVESHLTAVDASIGNRDNMNNNSFSGYGSIGGKDVASAVTVVASSIGTAEQLGKPMNGVSAENTVNSNIAAVNSAVGDVSGLKETIYASETNNVTDAVRALDSNMYRLDYQVNNLENKYNRLRRDFRIGMASMAAMSAMAPNARADGNTHLTIGTGAYADHTAVAVGAYHWVTNNLMFNAGVAWGDTRDAVYRMGMTYAF
jgi:hypothetical protein